MRVRLRSRIDPSSASFREHQARYEELLATLRERQRFVFEGNRAAQITRHRARGKLMVRERIDLAIDEHSPFLELSTLARGGSTATERRAAASSPGSAAFTACPACSSPTTRP
jgi:acetyl-CoA carboxylase carboxyltransferase component